MENKTIEYKGKVYEIGKYYLFGDSEGCATECLKLVYIVANVEGYVFKSKGNCWKTIRELPSSDNFGTITDKPVDLEDGAAYMFDTESRKNLTGLYIKVSDRFGLNDGTISKGHCSNIRKMGVIEE